tara:strand:+ start:415 stop:750 length:336 start_codon:yes stop_codon:yes gene_type:complete
MKKTNRANSLYAKEAMKLLAARIKTVRIEQKIKTTELAERAGISRDLLRRIEKGDPGCSIGTVFEVAALLGIRLFNSDIDNLRLHNMFFQDKLALLPDRVWAEKHELDDDF